jgi:IS5 family transposase
MGGKQLGFGDYEQSTAKKQTKREKFLTEMGSGGALAGAD